MYKLYILKSINFPKTYVGITNNLEKRIVEHNTGLTKFTSTYKPWRLIYSEDLQDKESARKREKYFKSCVGRKKIREIVENKAPSSRG